MSITTLILGGFNTQPPEGGWFSIAALCRSAFWFQHTAARRRLGNCANQSRNTALFQHTAARRRLEGFHNHMPIIWFGFNTQPPEGGWDDTNSTPQQ